VAKEARERVADVVGTAFAASVARLDTNAPALATERDPEAVHQARVATRRLRSDLRTLRDFVDASWARHLRAELRWLGSELGAVRDIEVLRERLSFHARLLPDLNRDAARSAIRRLDADHSVARSELLVALGSTRYAELHRALLEAVTHPQLTASARRRARKALPDAVRPTWRRLRRAVDNLAAVPSDAALHDVRIRAKRCRYACELAGPVVGRRARDLAAAVASVQDILGEHQDSVVADAWLAKVAPECTPTEAYALGMLAEVEHDMAGRARAAFPAAWSAARDPALRSWL
jgi:CHAD domain-containing protein